VPITVHGSTNAPGSIIDAHSPADQPVTDDFRSGT
jgi:hypothetical protein